MVGWLGFQLELSDLDKSQLGISQFGLSPFGMSRFVRRDAPGLPLFRTAHQDPGRTNFPVRVIQGLQTSRGGRRLFLWGFREDLNTTRECVLTCFWCAPSFL